LAPGVALGEEGVQLRPIWVLVEGAEDGGKEQRRLAAARLRFDKEEVIYSPPFLVLLDNLWRISEALIS
jgi:hypothetical protein